MQNPSRVFYTSSNGDRWLVVKAPAGGDVRVRHEPNQASGGKASEVDIATFIARGLGSAEGQALTVLLVQLRKEQGELGEADIDAANDDSPVDGPTAKSVRFDKCSEESEPQLPG